MKLFAKIAAAALLLIGSSQISRAADTYTPNCRIVQMPTGSNDTLWGTKANAAFAMLDQCISQGSIISVTGGNVTLTTANNAADQARSAIIAFTGTPGVTRTITMPNVSKLTWVVNSSNASLIFTSGAGTTATVAAGAVALIYTDAATNATAVLNVASSAQAVLTSGFGTGIATFLATPSSANLAAALTDETGTGSAVFAGSPTFTGGVGIGMTPSNILDITQTQNGSSVFSLKNASAGVSANSQLSMSNGTHVGEMRMFGTGFTTSVASRQDGMLLYTDGAGGMTYSIPSDAFRFYIGGVAQLSMSNAVFNVLQPALFLNGITATGFGGSIQLSGPGIDSNTDFRVTANSGSGVALLQGATSWSVYSDERLKKDFAPLPIKGALARVASWNPGTYLYKTDKRGAPRRVGLIAQSVQPTRPEAVSADKKGMLQVRLPELIPDLVAALKDQVDINKNLQRRIATLEAKSKK